MSFTISINEEAAFEVLFAGPAGPTGPQGIQGIQGVPGEGVAAGGTTGQVLKKLSATDYDTGWSSDISGVAWGAITGTLSSQTDLQNALDAKLSTSAASSTYLPLAGGYITGDIQSVNGSGYRTYNGVSLSAVLVPGYLQFSGTSGSLTVDEGGITFNSSPFKQTLPFLGLAGYATESWVTSNFYPLVGNPSGFLIASALTPYLTSADAAITYQTLAGMSSYLTTSAAASTYYLQTNPDGFITSAALVGYATESFVTTQGYITQTTADGLYYSIGNPSGFIGDAPYDGTTYGRRDGAWEVVGGGGLITSVTYPLAVNSGDLSIDLAGYATESWVQSQGYLTSVPPPSLTGLTSDISWDSYSHTGRLLIEGGASPDGMFFSARLNFADFTPNQPNGGDFWRATNKFQYTGSVGGVQTIASESWVTGLGYATTGQLSAYAPLAGATFTGKVNMAAPTAGSASLNLGVGTSPTTSVAGDIWIATNINFKDSSGTFKVVANTNTQNTFTQPQIIQSPLATTTAALRVTQLGTGNAIQVEDSTTPDATAFVVDQHGKVGIGVAPDATAAIKIDGNGMSFNGLVFNPTATAAHTGGSDTLDLLVTINGTNYRLGLRPA